LYSPHFPPKRKGLRTRLVTEITKDNISHCKELLTIIGELRHLDGIKGTFYLSERQYLAPAKLHEKGKPAALIIYSNVKEIVEHQQYVFDSFWSRALPAEERIRQIEEGTEPGVITIIRDYIQIQELGFKLVISSTFEILTIFSTANAFRRLVHVGAVQSLVEAAERGVKVRLLMPIDDKIRDMAQKLVEQKKIDIRYTVEKEVEQTLQSFLNLRTEKKEVTLEPILHPLVTELISLHISLNMERMSYNRNFYI
jgi:two-component system, OmpR family, sensor histidine kinase VicK